MKGKNIITVLFPTFFMFIVTSICFANMDTPNAVDFKGLIILSLVLLFPLIFLIQGIVSSLNNTNILLSLGASILGFILLMIIYLNTSAFIYTVLYLVFGTIGYLLTYFIKKLFKK